MGKLLNGGLKHGVTRIQNSSWLDTISSQYYCFQPGHGCGQIKVIAILILNLLLDFT